MFAISRETLYSTIQYMKVEERRAKREDVIKH